MAEIKISDLTPKGANLSVTDLLVISEDIGGGLYETKSITGDEILNAVAKTAVAVRNQTGATIYKGTIVYISGASGGKALISKAQANSEATSSKTLGVVTSDIANNANGNVLTNGLLTDLDTRTTATNPFTADTLAIGDDLYLSPTNAGYVTNVKPIAPNNLVNIGKVLETSGTTGQILYAIVNGYELGELHDVNTVGAVSGDSLAFDGTVWKPIPIDSTPTASSTNLVTSGGVESGLGTKQSTLVSGTNIKTVNGNTLLGSGDLVISGGGSGITIGTTPSTGTDTRVFFQEGGVVQQSQQFTFEEASNAGILRVRELGNIIYDLDARISAVFNKPIDVSGNSIFRITTGGGGNVTFRDNVTANSNIQIVTTSVGALMDFNGGGVRRVRIDSRSSEPTLQVRAQGALSTDIAFRVRNSADTENVFQVNGLREVQINGGAFYLYQYGSVSGQRITFGKSDSGMIMGIESLAIMNTNDNRNNALLLNKGAGNNIFLGSISKPYTAGQGNAIYQAVNTTINPTIANAASTGVYNFGSGNTYYVKTPDGSVIKLYKQDLPTNPTNAEIATLLSNLGFANLI